MSIWEMENEASSSGGTTRNLRKRPVDQYRRGSSLEDFQLNYDSIDILQWEDDDIALRSAAQKSRLAFNKPTMQEVSVFPELKIERSSSYLFLYLRNKMLEMWHRNPLMELTFEDFMNEIPSPYDSDPAFAKRIYEFLYRFGYINVGIFCRLTPPVRPWRKRVIVIGSGIAGLAAAQQMKKFGLDVVVVEARTRIGGRISTYVKPINNPNDIQNNRRACIVAELGASMIYGASGNPLMLLTKQCDVVYIPVNLQRCPIYDHTGKPVERRRTLLVERAFNNILQASTYMAHSKKVTEVNGRKLSLGDAFTVMLKQQDYRIQEKRISYFESYRTVLSKLKVIQDTMVMKKKVIERLHEAHSNLKAKEGSNDLTDEEKMENEIAVKCIVKDLNDAIKSYQSLDSKRKDINVVLAELAKSEPSAVYMNELDKRVLDFHIANLEWTVGASVNDVSMKDWNFGAEYNTIEGPNMFRLISSTEDGVRCSELRPTTLFLFLLAKSNWWKEKSKFFNDRVYCSLKITDAF